ncbi:hypothetical protein R1flu_028231 [Riccia fluitans]|uniref:Uncharacterized protein n=1 Tax=Riccia fluitans TaxID=41844 RepID=A0ABD1XQ41_9MARC
MHSGGTNTKAKTAKGLSSLHVHYEDARARARHVEFERETKELEKRYRATVLRSKEREEALQHHRAVSNVTKFELKNEKQKFEVEKSELRELSGLWRTLEVERLELVELRCQMKEFEAMRNGHTVRNL